MPQDRHQHSETILVRCPNWTGDIVMATPVLQCLYDNFPERRIVASVRRYARGILQDCEWLDRIIPIEDKSFAGMMRTVANMREEAPETAILLPNSFRAWFQVRLSNPHTIYGYRRGLRKYLMTEGPLPRRRNGEIVRLPMTEYYLDICRYMGLEIKEHYKPTLSVSDQLQAEGDAILENTGVSPDSTIIGINPGASFGSSKCWPVEHFARLAEQIEQQWNSTVVLFGSPGEKELTRTITEQSEASIVDTAPLNIDLEYLKPLIRRCNLLITNDTGPRHYGTAFDVPTVVLMGPTDPAHTASHLDRTAIVWENVDCAPCYKKICPRDHRCMKRITPERVLEEAQNLLESLN